MTEIVLASSSPYRAELLQRLGLEFSVSAPDVDESPLANEVAADLVARLARVKALAVADDHPSALIIGSDQVAVSGRQILGKPGTARRARAQLTSLSGRSVSFLTAVCLLNTKTRDDQVKVVETEVRFRELTRTEIAGYVEQDLPLDCAGAFKSEGLGIALLDAIYGPDPTALIGLPLIALGAMLRREGVSAFG